MPRSLSRASVLLVLTALVWAAARLGSMLFPPLDIAIPRMSERLAEGQQTWSGIPTVLIVAVMHVLLCVLVKTGLNLIRVVLTMTSVFIGLTALLSVVFLLLNYGDFTERAAVLGGQVHLTGWGIFVIAIEALAVVSTVIGLLLLYRPTSNAYIRLVRQLRSEAQSPGSS
jgi:hypothetical protein